MATNERQPSRKTKSTYGLLIPALRKHIEEHQLKKRQEQQFDKLRKITKATIFAAVVVGILYEFKKK